MDARIRPRLICLWIVAMALVLSACGAQSNKTHTTPVGATPSSTVISVPLVTVDAAEQQSGSLAQRNVLLTVEITVHNHTDQPISLFGTCQREAIVISLVMQGSGETPTEVTGGSNCPIVTGGYLQPAVSAHGAQTYTRHIDLFTFGNDWQAGAYVLTVTIPAWSQHPDSGFGGTASGSTTITVH